MICRAFFQQPAVSLQFDEGMPPHSKLDDILEKSKIYPLGRLYPFLQEV